ncbi:MAG: hypothetical protein IJB58_04255 [Bacteroidales bacterium]|nr:hypothetical protein [Bacteroidales bacterium]
MDKLYKFLFCALFSMSAVVALAQEQPEKSPEQIAATEVEHWESLLELTPSQTFYVDSILTHNYKCMFEDIERMRGMGMQSPDTYRAVQGKWVEKNVVAMKEVLEEQQYIAYLKAIGRGKEYKKGKDGLYYKKEDLAKQKDQSKSKK